MSAPSIQDEIACLRRELDNRRAYFPGLIAEGKLQREQAEMELACIAQTLNRLETWASAEAVQAQALAMLGHQPSQEPEA